MAREAKVDEHRAVVVRDQHVARLRVCERVAACEKKGIRRMQINKKRALPYLEVAMDDAIAVQPDEGARNAADDEYRVARARDAVGAQADRVLEHEVQLAALGEGAVHAHNVGMAPAAAGI